MDNEFDTYLVTGGAGFIGSALVHNLISNGNKVVTLDALTYAGNTENLAGVFDNPNHHFVHASILDGDVVATLLREHNPRYVINVAAETHVDRSIDGPRAFIDTNVVGTTTLLDAVREYTKGTNHKTRYVQVSTDEVYGTIAEGEFCETDPFLPNSPYAASKASADLLVRSYVRTFGLNAVITNGSNTYGPRQFPEKLIPLMILNALEGKDLPVYGDGKNIRDWLFVEDHAAGIVAAAKHGKTGQNYNIGGGYELENIKLVTQLCGVLDDFAPKPDGQYDSQIRFVADRPGHDFRYALSTDLAKRELGWSPRIEFETGLSNTVQWYLNNRAWARAITEKTYARDRLGNG